MASPAEKDQRASTPARRSEGSDGRALEGRAAEGRAPEGRAEETAALILSLRQGGVTDPAVLTAIERTPRTLFVPEPWRDRSWEDRALPIACGQTISQPLIVGLMTQALTVEPRARVLEIGTGSGYQTAVLSPLARLVYTIERYRTLMGEAEARLKTLGITNVITRFGDGGDGWPEQAPFDRILVTAAMETEPKTLLTQLKPNGVLVGPVGRGAVQTLRRYVGDGKGSFHRENLGEVRFVPLLPGVAREL